MKRWVWMLFLTTLLLTGCSVESPDEESSHQEPQARTPHIGAALYGVENDYMVRIASAISQYAEERRIQLELYEGNYDAATQLTQIETMLSEGVDGVILIPQSAKDSVVCVDRAVTAGIPIISVNTRVEHPGLTSRVGSDDMEAGRMLMRETAEALHGAGTVAILEGPPGQSAQLERREGMREALQEYPDILVISCKTANWSELEARIVVQKWLDTFEDLDAIIAQSDSMALGAATVCGEQGREDIVIVGMDGTPEAVRAVREGSMRMTIFQDAEEQARMALDVICSAVAGESVEPEYWIPLEMVTKNNAEDLWKE